MTLFAAEAIQHTDNDWQLILAAVLGIATVVVLITWLKVHPFLALILGAGVIGVVAAMAAADVVASFSAGVGATVGSVGLLIALGAMIGGMLAESGVPTRSCTPSPTGCLPASCRG
jgi:GntP family gluconate:H+ symporter